jgi:hypothetical protein
MNDLKVLECTRIIKQIVSLNPFENNYRTVRNELEMKLNTLKKELKHND